MKSKSKIKKKIFKEFIDANKNLIEKVVEEDKSSSMELKDAVDEYSSKFNTSDFSRVVPVAKFLWDYPDYYKHLTVGEMEFLYIFLRSCKDETLFKEVADEYLEYLENNKGENSLTRLKGLIGVHTNPSLTEEVLERISELTTLISKKEPDVLEIRKQIAHICRDLKITGEFISHCNRK